MPLDKVSPGEPFRPSASAWNAFVDAANEIAANKNSQDFDGELPDQSQTRILVKNATGQALPRFAVLGLSGPWKTPDDDLRRFQNEIIFVGVVPQASHRSRFVVLQEPLQPNQVGEATVAGVTVAHLCHSASEPNATWADVRPGDPLHLLPTASGSARILYRQASTCQVWGIVRINDRDGSTNTTGAPGSTTTTPPPCAGNCKWIWNASSNVWSLDSNNCGNTSTTSSTTAAPTTTSTTGGPTSSTTTTTSCPCTSTTTTAAPPAPPSCNCLYPSFCGTTDGECTWTQCASGNVQSTLSCTSTSSTTSTTGTPTTCDCNTTTTLAPPPGCTGGCSWAWLPSGFGSFVWVQTANFCLGSCPCAPPPSGGNSPCDTAGTECQTTPPPPPPPPPPPCKGSCKFWWIPSQSKWVLQHAACSGSNCHCVAPSTPGNVCAPVIVPCQSPPTTTTTSPGSTTTLAPCSHCYTSSTTSTTSTTTTLGPCNGTCKWQWSTGSSAWNLLSSGCASECPCEVVPFTGQADCEVAWTGCSQPTTSTTTTTQPPTTTTTTSSTTTTTTTTTTTSTTSTTTSSTTSSTTTTPPVGACCPISGSSCYVASQVACENAQQPGVWQGAGTSCNPDPCQPTSTSSTTTSSMTSTTTTPCPQATNSVQYRCLGGTWVQVSTNCDPGQYPVLGPPSWECNAQNEGLCAQITCGTTTTGAPTTSTTTNSPTSSSTTTTSSPTTTTTTTLSPSTTTTTTSTPSTSTTTTLAPSTSTTTTLPPTTTTTTTQFSTTTQTTTSSSSTTTSTTSTTTTTTCPPCMNTIACTCMYQWRGGSWVLVDSKCGPEADRGCGASGFTCAGAPTYTPSTNCECAFTYCVTTTTATPTTSTTTTTTTMPTLPPPPPFP